MDPATIAVIGLCVLLVLWYGAGYLYNKRRGRQLYQWLEGGLDVIGGQREAGWLGSPGSGARINILHASPPFRRLEITLLVKNREFALRLPIDRSRVNKDWLIVKATLRSPRQGEVEVSPAKGREARNRSEPWIQEEGPHGLAVAHQGSGASHQAEALKPWLETYGLHLDRFSWRKVDPHIQLQMDAGGLLHTSSSDLFTDLEAAIARATGEMS